MPALEHGVSWTRRWWRALVAELAATGLLVWLGLAAAVPLGEDAVPLAHVAAAFGFVVAGNCVAFGPASGAHMNPAVTAAAVATRRLPPAAGLAYVAAQCAGAVLGFGALLGTLPVRAGTALGVTRPAPAVSALGALVLEAALTGLLVLACCAAWAAHDPCRPDPAMPVKLGLLVAGLIYAGGPATGASLNPARSLAPALWHARWEHHWVYWVGPVGGALCAAALHRWVLLPPAPRPTSPTPEDLPLHNKHTPDALT